MYKDKNFSENAAASGMAYCGVKGRQEENYRVRGRPR
jgi:hypothetical protein